MSNNARIYIIFSKSNCSYCQNAIALLSEKQQEYREISYHTQNSALVNILRMAIGAATLNEIKKEPNTLTWPQIFSIARENIDQFMILYEKFIGVDIRNIDASNSASISTAYQDTMPLLLNIGPMLEYHGGFDDLKNLFIAEE